MTLESVPEHRVIVDGKHDVSRLVYDTRLSIDDWLSPDGYMHDDDDYAPPCQYQQWLPSHMDDKE